MSGFAILEVGIGLVFVYLLLSLLCTTINELISRLFSLRAKTLRDGIKQLLADPNMDGLAQAVYDHPLIKNVSDTSKIPSYISSESFARVLVDIIDPNAKARQDGKAAIESIRAAVHNIQVVEVRNALLPLIGHADTALETAQSNITGWFDDAMDRVSGWYKRKIQILSLAVALIVSVAINANTFVIANDLWNDPVLRQSVVEMSQSTIVGCRDPKEVATCERNIAQLQKRLRPLPLGWSESDKFVLSIETIFGWVLTALAVSLGAPFWFEVLNKLNSIRSTGVKPQRATE